MHQDETRRQVRHVLVITLVLNLVVAGGKIIIGAITGALAITADGFHSLMDGTSNVAGLVANHYAARPPDEDHPYGHRRFETLAALLIGALLLVTAWEIAGSALHRLQSGDAPALSPLAFAVLIGTLIGNIFISRYQIREGRRLRSELVLADAANTSTDVFVTASVILSMVMVALTGWAWVDLVAALVVVVLIVRAAWQVLNQTTRVLVDTAPYPANRLHDLVTHLPGVDRVVRARSRGTVDNAHVDIDVQVAPAMTAAQTAVIRDAIINQLETHLDGIAEVEVHFAPDIDTREHDYGLVTRAAAAALGLSTHEVRVTDHHGDKTLELHVEVAPDQTLEAAHEQVNCLERDLHTKMPHIAEIVTHIEPAQLRDAQSLTDGRGKRIIAQATSLLNTQYPDIYWHHIRVYDGFDGVTLTMHAAIAPDVTIEYAHQIAESAEAHLRLEIPALNRVTIHTEPEDHATT